MLFRAIHLLALGAGTVRAQQAPLSGGPSSCLSSTSGSRGTALNVCCPTPDAEGKGTVDGTVFTYKCSRTADKHEAGATDAASPRECAQKCARDASCAAGTWDARKGRCYFTREGVFFDAVRFESWILITKTEETGTEEPGPVDHAAAVAQCNNEKDAIRREMTSQCEAEVQGQKTAHEGALKQAEDRCKEEKAQCEADKAALRRDKEMCEKEKSEKIQEGIEAEKQCKSQVDDLKKQVKDLEDKVRSGSDSDKGPDTDGGSGPGPGPAGFVQTGDPACEKISTYSHCKPGCKNFAIDRVEYELRCNAFAERTERTKSNAYKTINECLANKCNKEANCLGVSWTPNGWCVFHYPKRAGLAANVVPKGGNWHHVMKLSS